MCIRDRLEAGRLIDHSAIGGKGRGGEFFHRGKELGARRVVLVGQQRGFERGGGEDLEVAPAEFRVGVFRGDHLALFGDADLALHRALRLRQDGLVVRAAAAADRTAATVEDVYKRQVLYLVPLHCKKVLI